MFSEPELQLLRTHLSVGSRVREDLVTKQQQQMCVCACVCVCEESACNAGDIGLIPGVGRSPGKGNGNPLQYSCLGNPMDRGAWWATVHGVAKSRTQLSN